MARLDAHLLCFACRVAQAVIARQSTAAFEAQIERADFAAKDRIVLHAAAALCAFDLVPVANLHQDVLSITQKLTS